MTLAQEHKSPGDALGDLPGWPAFGADELAAVARVLASGRVNYWTGEEGSSFEREFAASVGCEHGVALSNGTVALELALRALGVGAGDEVVVPSRTFIATASAVAAVGGRPVVADVEQDSHNVSARTVAPHLTGRTRAVVAVHYAGWPADVDELRELLRPRGVRILEDCAQAHGALLRGRPVGSLGDAAAWSFCQDKILTTGGEGGMVTTHDHDVRRAVWSYKDHGKVLDSASGPAGPPRFVHASFGSNARMTEMQAALGRVVLRRLPRWVAVRQRNAEVLRQVLQHHPALAVPRPPDDVSHSYYTFQLLVDERQLRAGHDRDSLVRALQSRAVPCRPGRAAIHTEPAFPPSWRPAGQLPVCERLSASSITLLVHPTLGESHMRIIAETVLELLEEMA